MRKGYIKLCTLTVLLLSVLAQSQGQTSWVKQLSPATEHLSSIFFLDTETGWSVGESGGVILKTTDGGASWTQIAFDQNTSYYDIYFADKDKGWAVGSRCLENGCDGIIIYTGNGGANWTEKEIVKDIYFLSLHFVSNTTGWATTGPFGTIYKTTDGGMNWTAQETGRETDFYDCHFFDVHTGLVAGRDGLIMRTTDGGENWTQKSAGLADSFNGLHFVNENLGWAAGTKLLEGEAVLASTSNGGLSWSIKTIVEGNVGFNDVKFIDENRGWIVGESEEGAVVYYSKDGGKNLESQSHNASINNFKALAVTDAKNAWISGDDGNILRMVPDPTLGTGDAIAKGRMFGNIYPNPGSGLVNVPFNLSADGHASLLIYDLSGKIAAHVLDEYLPAGKHTQQVNIENLTDGIYLFKIQSKGFSETQKLVVY